MFKNVGNEIKTWAKIFFGVIIVGYVITAVVVMVALIEVELAFLGFLSLIGIILFGYLMARLSVILLYAFGDLVENVSQLKRKFADAPKSEETDRIKAILAAREAEAHTEKVQPGSWVCMNCGTRNNSGDKWCKGCNESTKS